MNTPFISIFMKFYNNEKTLPKTLEAIRNQTSKQFELILVDNGSSDRSFAIAEQFKSENKNIEITILRISKNNLRIATELAVAASKGTYLLENDSDDWMEPDCIELLAQKALATDADIVAGLYQEVTPNGIRRKRSFSKHPSRWTIVVEQGVAFRKELFVMVPEEYNVFGDLYRMGYMCSKAKIVAFVDKIIFNFFHHSASNFNAKKYELDTILNISKNIIDIYRNIFIKEPAPQEQNIICYAATKKTYEFIILGIRDKTIKDKKTVVQFLNNLKIQFPAYRKNPAIKLTDNGYCFRARLSFYAVYLLDICNLWSLPIFYYSHKRS
ncbi:glycosyltransferase family 2 protein [Treponema sp. Marseille-Q4523]|uniref:glycosyltransferase family 2 protein n=1 Tax=Treponema sp. Marseille-Q4523 TaxID=2810610 RepID=UPI001960463E|nr:glycosyltransferase family 2 protein [Treponema sp. Marseille-Q4523]MBM7024188.1 glycosyltransferase family 2 protein [Treponema sp. Marseille-Q4523]